LPERRFISAKLKLAKDAESVRGLTASPLPNEQNSGENHFQKAPNNERSDKKLSFAKGNTSEW
jgi:hypothetical protein